MSKVSTFCKLFETEKHGQILVKLDGNNEGAPEVRFYAAPEGLGVCSVAALYTDDDAGWDRAEEYFARVDQTKAIAATAIVFKLGEKQ